MSKGGDVSTGKICFPVILLVHMTYTGIFLKVFSVGPGNDGLNTPLTFPAYAKISVSGNPALIFFS